MLNDVAEAFFDEALRFPFTKLLMANGVPTAQINATFLSPSRQGDELDFEL